MKDMAGVEDMMAGMKGATGAETMMAGGKGTTGTEITKDGIRQEATVRTVPG